jgi:hydrogenase maturation protease
MDQKKVLIFGIGNPGRGDDGLGPELIERLRRDPQTHAEFPGTSACVCEFEFRYQLNIEDAFAIKDHHLVIFADAATTGDVEAALTEAFPSDVIAFTTHRMSPAAVLALCHELYGRTPKAYILSIRGHQWDIREGLSSRAEANLNQALDIVRKFLDTI